jgi:hypothetical protein
MPNSGYTVRGLHERSGCRAGPTMTTLSTRHLFLSSGGVSPWKSTVPMSCWISHVLNRGGLAVRSPLD